MAGAEPAQPQPEQLQPGATTPAEALTCDQNHGYTPEQEAFDGGKMDMFVQDTQTDLWTGEFGPPGIVMDYYYGNTVTALWNYAQNYAMSDNNYDTNFGPPMSGALNVISGNDGDGYAVIPIIGAVTTSNSVSALNSKGLGTIYGDCSVVRRLLGHQPHLDQPGRRDDRQEHR